MVVRFHQKVLLEPRLLGHTFLEFSHDLNPPCAAWVAKVSAAPRAKSGYLGQNTGIAKCPCYRSGGIKQLSHSIHVWYTYLHLPIYIFHKNQPNVGEYTIHGWYGENVIW